LDSRTALTDNKTQPTEVDVEGFIAAVDNERRRADTRAVVAMMERISGWKPRMWGPSIIGFGRYSYTYESGHSGHAPVLGVSPRKVNLVVYTDPAIPGRDALVRAIGKVKSGVSCVYVNRLSDIDLNALEVLVRASMATTRARWTISD
jgi:hypothetical protein